jgi:hypothetical protein
MVFRKLSYLEKYVIYKNIYKLFYQLGRIFIKNLF